MKPLLIFILLLPSLQRVYAQVIMHPHPVNVNKPAQAATQVHIQAQPNTGSADSAEAYFLEIINQKDMEIVSRNASLLQADNEKQRMQFECRQSLLFVSLLQALSCNNLAVLEQAFADSDNMRTIESLDIGNGVLNSVTLLLYQNQFHDQLAALMSSLRSCNPNLENLFATGTARIAETDAGHSSVSPNQIILPVFPRLTIGSSASAQYMEFIEMLVSRYAVPEDVLAAYKEKEQQNIPDGNEEQLVKARKLFILYLHAKFKK